MALGRSVTDGFRKLTVNILPIAGAQPDAQSLSILPILRPYTVFGILRIVDGGGNTFDVQLQWQATPRLPDNAGQGPAVGYQPGQAQDAQAWAGSIGPLGPTITPDQQQQNAPQQ